MSDASDYRWNFEEGVHGRVLRCTNDHPKGYPCEYEPLTTEEAEGMADLIAKQGAEIATLRQKLEQAEARADACQLQAQIWKQEARAQSSTVAKIYQELTGKTGEPGDWNGVRPLKPAILRKQAEAVDEVNRLLTTISEEVESGAMDACLVVQYAASTAGEEADRLRQQADELEKESGQ